MHYANNAARFVQVLYFILLQTGERIYSRKVLAALRVNAFQVVGCAAR